MRNIEQLNIEREDPILDQDDEKEATKEERINTESFLADLKERGSKFFDSEGVKKGLLEKGIEHEDVQVATDLMSCIASINESLGIKEDLSLNFSISQNEFGDVAGFSSSDKEKDGYVVYARGISSNILESIHKIPQVDDKGFPVGGYSDWDKPTMEEILISTATHEARHRLQHHKSSIINPEKIKKYDNNLLRSVAKYVNLIFEEEIKQYHREKRSEEYIEHKTNRSEFDARVIEVMTLIKLHSGTTKEDLQGLLNLQG